MAEILPKTFIMPHPHDHLSNPKILPTLLNRSLFCLRWIITDPYSSGPLYHLTPSPDHNRLSHQLLGWPETHCATVSSQYEERMTSCLVFCGKGIMVPESFTLLWVTTPYKIWTTNPAVIAGNICCNPRDQCTVKLDLWLLVMKEETEVQWAAVALFRVEEWVCRTFWTKHLSLEAMPCYVSFLCSYDFVR